MGPCPSRQKSGHQLSESRIIRHTSGHLLSEHKSGHHLNERRSDGEASGASVGSTSSAPASALAPAPQPPEWHQQASSGEGVGDGDCSASLAPAPVPPVLQRVTSRFEHLRGRPELFDEMDADGNGSVSLQEAESWFRLEKNRSWAEQHKIHADTFLHMLDKDGDGKISREEFAAWLEWLERNRGEAPVVRVVSLEREISAYGHIRFLAHNKYLSECLNPDLRLSMHPTDVLTLERDPDMFAYPEHSLTYEFSGGRSRGNFLTQIDGFVTREEAQRIIAAGCKVKRKMLGIGSGPPGGTPEAVSRMGSALAVDRSGTVAFDRAYKIGWVFFQRAREWLPRYVVDGPRRWKLKGINPRFRLVHYDSDGMGFGMHFDSLRWGLETELDDSRLPFTSSEVVNHPDAEVKGQHSFLTMNLYLNDAKDPGSTFGGGRIVCYEWKQKDAERTWQDDGAEMTQREKQVLGEAPLHWGVGSAHKIEPVAGRMLIFGQGRLGGIMHEAEEVSCSHLRMEDQKWILRTDVTYELA